MELKDFNKIFKTSQIKSAAYIYSFKYMPSNTQIRADIDFIIDEYKIDKVIKKYEDSTYSGFLFVMFKNYKICLIKYKSLRGNQIFTNDIDDRRLNSSRPVIECKNGNEIIEWINKYSLGPKLDYLINV